MKELNEIMLFNEKIEDFLEAYSFKDNNEIYTNGSELIQLYRVKQALDHYYYPILNKVDNKELTNIDEVELINTTSDLKVTWPKDYWDWLNQICPPPSEEAIERNRRILKMRHKMSDHEDNFSKLVSYIDHELAELQGAYIPQDMTEGRVHAAKIKLLQNILKKAEEIEDGR